jgi:hypothetical protein
MEGISKRYISWKTRYIRYIIELEWFNPLHFRYTKRYSRYIIVSVMAACPSQIFVSNEWTCESIGEVDGFYAN